MHLDANSIIQAGGILLVAAVIFAESGLLIGFFLPGDTLLFGAGLAASQGKVSLLWLCIATALAAIIGDNVGYFIGESTGNKIFNRDDGILFKKEHIKQAQDFYDKHGGKTIILARFTPIVRTFVPVAAGIGKMPRKRFFVFNALGGILWGVGMPLLGFWLGSKIPGLDHYIEKAIIGVVLLSLIISVGHIFRDKENRTRLKQKARTSLRKAKRRK